MTSRAAVGPCSCHRHVWYAAAVRGILIQRGSVLLSSSDHHWFASLTDLENVSCGWSTKSSIHSTGVSEFKVSYNRWKSHRHADLLRSMVAGLHRFAPPSVPLSSKAALSRLFRGRARDFWYCLELESSFATGSLAVYQLKFVSRSSSTRGCPNLVDLILNAALSFSWTPT